MATSRVGIAASDERLRELLGLIKGADSVELKLTVPESDRFAALTALGVDPLDAVIRQVFFFDTPDLALDTQGVVVRARRTQAKADDTVVKLRPVQPDDLSKDLRAAEDFGVEVDAMPGGFVCSASYKRKVPGGRVKDFIGGAFPLRKLFSKEQRAFYAANAPEGLAIDDLRLLGPITAFKLKVAPDGAPLKFAVELWNYPSGTRILELSTKCAPADAFRVAAEARAYLSDLGIDLEGKQETKTKTALTYFAKGLQEQGA
jgi:hypothetical protein